MKKIIDKADIIIHKISISFVIILFAIIVIGMLFINSIYLYNDSPDFKVNNVLNFLGIIINIVGIVLLVLANKFIQKKFPKNKYITVGMFVLYFIAEIIYLKLVPIKPFSDMKSVVQIATSGFKEGMEYIYVYPNNLPIAAIFYFLFKIYNGVMVVKITNIVCNMLIIYFAYKTYKNIYKKKNRLVLLFGIFSISTFLYVNHVYNDVMYVALTTVILYITTKEELVKKDIILLALLSFLQFLIRPVGIILIIAISMYLILKKYDYKTVIVIIATFILCNLIYIPVKNYFIPKSEEKLKYPIWSFLQMGINLVFKIVHIL